MCAYHKEYAKQYTEAHKEEKKEYDRIRNIKNREKNKIYNQSRKKQRALYDKIYREENREIRKVKRRIYNKKKWNTNPVFKLNIIMSSGIRKSLKGNKSGWHWENLVSYTLKQLKKHLEEQFTEDMTWDNYGKYGWHIDHKIPINAFNFTEHIHDDFKKCWALSNLQPMWAYKNLKKSNKLDKHFQPSLLLGI